MSQITYIPKNIYNTRDNTSTTTWYSKNGRPLKIWRKSGYTNSLNMGKSANCDKCSSNYTIGTEFKMLGKYISPSALAVNGARDASGCRSVDNTRGPVGTKGTGSIISFSGGAKIKSAVTQVNKKYYANSSSYLKSRNMDYNNNTFITKLSGVTYYDGSGNFIRPTDEAMNSSMFQGRQCADNTYNTVIYKPSNHQYGVEGAVDSSSRVARLKYNTMQKAGKYSGDKKTAPVCYRRNGTATKCFKLI